MNRAQLTIDGNEAAAYIAYKTNEVIAIYPITPSTPMGELADAWAAAGERNLWGSIPRIQEMQSEGGAAGAVHGALQTGALTTTFTASQGLLLMIPNMYKIAGELTSAVFHIAARSVASHALSIFGDHSDVMAARSTGWAMLFASSVQEVMDFALISQAATLESRIPFLHVFDGFRTSHEIATIEKLPESTIRGMIEDDLVRAHRRRSLSPEHPVIRGTAQNPDVFFQGREASNPFYLATPVIVQSAMDRLAGLTGRQYCLFNYVGAPDAERVIVLMGSGCETVEATVHALVERSERVGVLKVRLYRPFASEIFLDTLPETVKAIAILDRTKEPGAAGEPLYEDIMTALSERENRTLGRRMPIVIGGRYGLSSKEFTPAMAKAVFDELEKPERKNHFTIGINDDVTHSSLEYDPSFSIEPVDEVRAIFWGLGADGTVGANKNTVKIIGEQTKNFAQGYFVYDSKKSGSVTVSHLRLGPRPIHSPYLIRSAGFVAVHQFDFMERMPVLENAAEGATLLLNSPYGPEEILDHLPSTVRQQITDKRLNLYVIDGYAVANEAGMGRRINTVMQACFFALSGVLPRKEAIAQIKAAIKKTYGKRGDAVVHKNYAAVDAALAHLHRVDLPLSYDQSDQSGQSDQSDWVDAPDFVRNVTAELIAGRGDSLPVSALPADGTYPVGTSRWEKRNIAQTIPVWNPNLCIQCGKCILVCPHAVIRAKVADSQSLEDAPAGFKTMPAKWREMADQQYTIQVSVEDCTGCELCVEVCPGVDKADSSHRSLNMEPQRSLRSEGAKNWEYFLKLPEVHRTNGLRFNTIKNVQLLQPLFEFSGACSGCGETPYLKLLSQLFGDRAVIANATGCSSIFGGNLPTTPWTTNRQGRGPAWSNSLFEDNAEFGLGMRLALDQQAAYARRLVEEQRERIGAELCDSLLSADLSDESGIEAQRGRVVELKARLASSDEPSVKDLVSLSDHLVKKSVWIVGGDGWAYDIGYGGLDHVLASGEDVNILVLDTEVYSNTGGQASKSTSLGAVAKFASGGKPRPKKDLGRMAMAYGNVYVAQVAMGANDSQVVKTFIEAEAYKGPSLIIAYSHCIAHGIEISKGLTQQRLAVESGYWPIYRYNPELEGQGKTPFQLDCKAPTIPLTDYIYSEDRFRVLLKSDPESARRLAEIAQHDVDRRWQALEMLAAAPAASVH